jgi:Carboxypeptidase regulatory-like domain
MRKIAIAIALMFASLAAVQSVRSSPQQGAGILSGVVLGPDDKPVKHASVTYQSAAGNAPHAVFTDSHGRFTITKLKTDDYDLRASANGVFSQWEKNVMVRSGQTKSVTLRLVYAKQMPKAYGATSQPQHQ